MTTEIYKSTGIAGDLIDGVERNAQHPETFPIPSPAEKDRVGVGNLVKIGIDLVDGGERFWVRVMADTLYGAFIGDIANTLVQVDAGPGDIVIFYPQHILDIDFSMGEDEEEDIFS